jgi:predicted protein tyrosine phosphatase
MQFRVMPHHAASKYSPREYGHQHAVMVRVTSLDDFIPLNHADEFDAVLPLFFDDMTQETYNTFSDHESAGIHLFTREMAQKIVDFYIEWAEKCDVFVVHCDAGASRSPAIAMALAEYGHHDDELNRMLKGGFHPNPLVWSTIRRVVGWNDQRQSDLEAVFSHEAPIIS